MGALRNALELVLLCITPFLILNCAKKAPDGQLFLPDGFTSVVVVDSTAERVRHLAVSPDNILYAKLRDTDDEASIEALEDTDHNGTADVMEKFGVQTGPKKFSYETALRIYNGYLYFSSELVVYRIKLDLGSLTPRGKAEVVLTDDHPHGRHEHIGKPLAFDDEGNMYVPFGAPSNACQEPKRTPGSPGLDPCPQLADHGGIWKFDANKLGQTQKDGTRFASGIRSLVAMDWNPADKTLYAVIHGRDDLYRLWPNRYTTWQSALLPSEEFVRIPEGADFGWPYCYYDQIQEKKVLAPEYGGDGKIVGRCSEYDDPIIGFPGHWAPNDLVFYQGDSFPEHYRNGAFIAFHGSTNRAPYPQAGYFVGFVPFRDGKPSGPVEVFADGFAQVDPIISVKDAVYRPMGIAFGPDGGMYISDSVKGKIWKISFEGDRSSFGEAQLATMEERKNATHIRTPDPITDNLIPEGLTGGEKIYNQYCSVCHQLDGNGASGRFPPLNGTDWVLGDKQALIELTIRGMEGSITVGNEVYNGVMPQHSFLSNSEIADVLTYIRSHFGNAADPVNNPEVEAVRKMIENGELPNTPIDANLESESGSESE